MLGKAVIAAVAPIEPAASARLNAAADIGGGQMGLAGVGPADEYAHGAAGR